MNSLHVMVFLSTNDDEFYLPMLVDTGAEKNLLSTDAVLKMNLGALMKQTNIQLTGVGTAIAKGKIDELLFKIGSLTVPLEVIITDLPVVGILGMNFDPGGSGIKIYSTV